MIMVVLELLIGAALVAVLLLGRSLRRQLESLRAEIAAARIAGVLDHNDPVP